MLRGEGRERRPLARGTTFLACFRKRSLTCAYLQENHQSLRTRSTRRRAEPPARSLLHSLGVRGRLSRCVHRRPHRAPLPSAILTCHLAASLSLCLSSTTSPPSAERALPVCARRVTPRSSTLPPLTFLLRSVARTPAHDPPLTTTITTTTTTTVARPWRTSRPVHFPSLSRFAGRTAPSRSHVSPSWRLDLKSSLEQILDRFLLSIGGSHAVRNSKGRIAKSSAFLVVLSRFRDVNKLPSVPFSFLYIYMYIYIYK